MDGGLSMAEMAQAEESGGNESSGLQALRDSYRACSVWTANAAGNCSGSPNIWLRSRTITAGREDFRAAPANGKAQVKVPASSVPQPKMQVLITGVNEDTLSYILSYENEAKPLY